MHEREARETRGLSGIEIRDGDGRPPRLVGYAASFDSPSQDLGTFTEVVRAGCFARSLRERDVLAFVEHDPSLIIGRQSNGSLTLAEDHRGLRVEITPLDTTAGRDVLTNVRAGLLKAMSFAFRVPAGGDRWSDSTRPPRRELIDVDLFETSVVASPAYTATEVAVRSFQAWQQTHARGAESQRGPRTVAECTAQLRARERFWEIQLRQKSIERRLALDRPIVTPPPSSVTARLRWLRQRAAEWERP